MTIKADGLRWMGTSAFFIQRRYVLTEKPNETIPGNKKAWTIYVWVLIVSMISSMIIGAYFAEKAKAGTGEAGFLSAGLIFVVIAPIGNFLMKKKYGIYKAKTTGKGPKPTS